MGLFSKIGIVAFIGANAKIFFRAITSSIIIFILNFIYSKYEVLLLTTNPENLFIPLYAYTVIVTLLVIWTLMSLTSFSSFKNAKKNIEIKNSFTNKPDEYERIRDITRYPTLKSFKDKITRDE